MSTAIRHRPQVIRPEDAMKELPWVHTIIANARGNNSMYLTLSMQHICKITWTSLYTN